MADIILSNAVRANLLSLQNTAKLTDKTQTRLATGLKVNSALDDPTAFFTASSLNARAGDLNRILDTVGNAVQTLKAANDGLTALTKLLETAQATALQALQKPLSSPATVVGTGASIDLDTAAVVTGQPIAADITATISSANLANDAAVLALTGVLTVEGPNGTYSIDFDGTSGTSGVQVNSVATLSGEIALASAATGLTFGFAGATNPLVITAPNNTTSFTVSGTHAGLGGTLTNGAKNPTNAAVAALDTTMTIQIGNNTATSVDFNIVSNRQQLAASLAFVEGGTVTLGATGEIIVTATNPEDDIVISASGGTAAGNLTTLYGGLSGGGTSFLTEATNASLAALAGQSINVSVGAGAAQTITFGTDDSSSEINTRAELEARLAAIEATFTDSTFSLDTNGNLTITAGNSDDSVILSALTNSVTTLGAFGIASFIGTTAPGPNASRQSLENEYNNLRNQIDLLITDANFNGINLLNGDNLSVAFNENNTSSLTITGVTLDSEGLGVTQAVALSFQNNTTVNATLDEVNLALAQVRQQASVFGSNLSVIEIRQDFTKNLINTLETGAANLTLADPNEEGANLLALQTRQQLSSVALSLASQADQNVLRLF